MFLINSAKPLALTAWTKLAMDKKEHGIQLP